MSKEDTVSPTSGVDSIMLTSIIDAYEGRDIMSADVPNTFIQAKMTTDGSRERFIMKITGVLIDILVNKDPGKYKGYVVYENGKHVLYVALMKALYGMLDAALFWYKRFRKDLEEIRFIFNNYDPCVANKIIDGKQLTIRFHVDDIMSSHVDPTVNDDFLVWLNWKYGEHGEMKATRGKEHDYLGMTLRFKDRKVEVDMTEYVKNMLEEFPVKFNDYGKVTSSAGVDLFNEDLSKKLNQNNQELFHRTVAKALFLCKRARPDIQTTVIVLCSRVRAPGRRGWKALVRLMKYLHMTRDNTLVLSTENGISIVE